MLNLHSYKLRFKEKFGNSSGRQLLRLLKNISFLPLRGIKKGVLKVMVNLTYRCHCDCDYCWCGDYQRNPEDEMSFTELKQAVSQIAQYPSLFTMVSFVGGEPFLRSDIYGLIDYSVKRGLFTEMETNGVELSEDNVLKLKKSGLSHLFVRIEGSDRERHDAISRLEGCFDKAISGIKNCRQFNLPVSIFMNASREKIAQGEIKRIIDLGRELKAGSIRVIFPVLSGRWISEEARKLTPEEETEVKALLEPGFVYLESSDACFKNTQRICAAAKKEFFHISCYGEVQPCPFVPLSFGNVRVKKLESIVGQMWKHDVFTGGYHGCLMNNPKFRNRYILPAHLESVYKNIVLYL